VKTKSHTNIKDEKTEKYLFKKPLDDFLDFTFSSGANTDPYLVYFKTRSKNVVALGILKIFCNEDQNL
jgi:hypothetical protein